MSVLLLIDGSGSMAGERRNSAMISSVILHEVLKKQGIQHAIVEHRAHYGEPEIDVNILVDFNAKEEEKLNIMQLDAENNTGSENAFKITINKLDYSIVHRRKPFNT